MSFLLDTNICSAHLKRPAGLVHRFIQYSGRLYTPSIVLGELYAWAYRRDDPAVLIDLIEHDLLNDLKVLPYDVQSARTFGQMRGTLLNRGISINSVDLMIGAVALVHDITLVTHNVADFERIPSLRIVDWMQ